MGARAATGPLKSFASKNARSWMPGAVNAAFVLAATWSNGVSLRSNWGFPCTPSLPNTCWTGEDVLV